MTSNNTDRVVLTVDMNRGYSAEQIERSMSLGDLLELVQDAVERFGDDAMVVLQDPDNRFGAGFGRISGRATIEAPEPEFDDDEPVYGEVVTARR